MESSSSPQPQQQQQQPKQSSYILIENPSKSNNLGPILRCATAFAIQQVIFVGYEKCSVKGSHGSSKHVNIKAFVNFEQAVTYLKQCCGVVSIIGILGDVSLGSIKNDNDDNSDDDEGHNNGMVEEDVEHNVVKVTARSIFNDKVVHEKDSSSSSSPTTTKAFQYPLSHPVHKRPFPSNGNVCFSISRRAVGLPIHQAQYCDSFVHIQTSPPMLPSQSHTSATTTSTSISSTSNTLQQNNIQRPYLVHGLLDSQTCLSITLHHFNAFAKYDERIFEGQKFHVEKNQVRGQMKFDIDGEEVRRMRLERKEQLNNEVMETLVFDDDNDDE